jgi:LmbE family N-acetylglucosaminyl deacetylase
METEVRLVCVSEGAAEEVMERVDTVPLSRRKEVNSARREGDVIVITYADKMWPYDIADMADDLGLASNDETAKVFACI